MSGVQQDVYGDAGSDAVPEHPGEGVAASAGTQDQHGSHAHEERGYRVVTVSQNRGAYTCQQADDHHKDGFGSRRGLHTTTFY